MEQYDSCDGGGFETYGHDNQIDVEKLSMMPGDSALHREKIPFYLMNNENFMGIESTLSKNRKKTLSPMFQIEN